MTNSPEIRRLITCSPTKFSRDTVMQDCPNGAYCYYSDVQRALQTREQLIKELSAENARLRLDLAIALQPGTVDRE